MVSEDGDMALAQSKRSRQLGIALVGLALLALAVLVVSVVLDWGLWSLIPIFVLGFAAVNAAPQFSGPESFFRWRPAEQGTKHGRQ